VRVKLCVSVRDLRETNQRYTTNRDCLDPSRAKTQIACNEWQEVSLVILAQGRQAHEQTKAKKYMQKILCMT